MKKQSIVYKVFKAVAAPLIGSGIGRFPAINSLYQKIFSLVVPKEVDSVMINDCRMLLFGEGVPKTNGIGQSILIKGEYEPFTTQLFRKLVKPGMTVIDIGANIGYFTLLSSRLVGEQGKVIAFEPADANYRLLMKNISINGMNNVVAIQKAVSDKEGTIDFFINEIESGAHSIYGDNKEHVKKVKVDTLALAGYCSDENIRPDIIKIDVEGAEPEVINGAEEILQKLDNVVVLIEFSPGNMKKSGRTEREFWDKLSDSGLKFIYVIDDQKKSIEKTDFKGVMGFFAGILAFNNNYVNLVCSKNAIDINQ